MGQVTIYIESGIEKNTTISKKISNEWPLVVMKLAGAWKDFPSLEEIRNLNLSDSKREIL